MQPSDDVRSGLRLPQFRLRTLMLWISGLCVFFAVVKFLSPAAIVALVIFLMSVAAHVAGNALGTQLRDRGSRPLPRDEVETIARQTERRTLTTEDFAPASRLSQRETLGGIVIPGIVVGAALMAIGGGFWLANLLGEKLTFVKLAIGIFALGVLGGILGFLVSTFVKAMITANVDAWRSGPRP